MLKEQARKALAAKFGEDNLKVVEEAVTEVAKEIAKENVDLKAEVEKANKQNGYLSRKVKSVRSLATKALHEQKVALLRMAEKFTNREVAKRETLVDELIQKNKTVQESMAKEAEVFFEKKVIPQLRKDIVSNVKGRDHFKLIESISRVIVGSKKRNDAVDVKALKTRVSDLQENLMKLAADNQKLRNENVFLKETKELKKRDVQEIKESVDLGSKDSSTRIQEAKTRIMERKRRSLISPPKGDVDAEEIVRKNNTQRGILPESMTQRIIGLVE